MQTSIFVVMDQLDDISALHDSFQKLTEGLEGYSLVLLDENGTILTWNKGVEKIKGYKAHEIIGQHISIFYTPQDREDKLADRLLDEARRNGKAHHVGKRVRKNGTIFWGSIEIVAIRNSKGKVIGFTKLARELNEEFDIGLFWFDNEGVLHTKANPIPHTEERIREYRAMLHEAAQGDKVCCVADVRDAVFTEEGLSFSVASIPKLYKAIAFVVNDPIDDNTRRLIDLLPPEVPVKTFHDRTDARNWVARFLDS